MKLVAEVARSSFTGERLSAGPVVATLAVITLVALVTVLALAYVMYLRDRR